MLEEILKNVRIIGIDGKIKENMISKSSDDDPYNFYHVSLNGDILLRKHQHQIKVPFNTNISLLDFLYSLIRAENYDDAIKIIHSVFNESTKIMKKQVRNFPKQFYGARYRLLCGTETGSRALIKIYHKTSDEKYVNMSIRLWDGVVRTRDEDGRDIVDGENIGEIMERALSTGSEFDRSKSIHVYLPNVQKAIIRTYIKQGKNDNAIKFVNKFEDPWLREYVNTYQRMLNKSR